jgi:simple sugar transport system permease protein
MTSNTETKATEDAVVGRSIPQRSKLSRFVRSHALQIGILGVAVFVWMLFYIGSPQTFSRFPIYRAFMSTTPFFAIMALPLTLVIIAKEIDLSFPSIMTFGMLIFTTVLAATRNVMLAFIALLLAGLLAGLINGLLVVRIGIPALVATIGTSFFWRGVVLVSTGGNGSSLVPTKETFLYPLLVGRLFGVIPMQFVWTLLIAFAVWLFLNRTRQGAHVYLVGDNEDSARLMGVNVGRTKLLVFSILGMAAAFAGLVVSMEVLYYWPTLGEGYLLSTLSSVFLGGTSVFGGTGTIFGTLVAAFIIGAINAGIVAAGMAGFWTQLIYGLIIVGSVSMQVVVRRRLA